MKSVVRVLFTLLFVFFSVNIVYAEPGVSRMLLTMSPILAAINSLCNSTHLNNCINESTCTSAEGYWYGNRCNDENFSPVVSAGGQIWMDRNLGASRVATSSTDSEAYGDLYQWGRLADGHEKRTSSTTEMLSDEDVPGHDSFIITRKYWSYHDWRSPVNNNLWQGVDGINNPCPMGYRLPTELEWEIEMNSWSPRNITGALSSPLRLVAAGLREQTNGGILGVIENTKPDDTYLYLSGNYWYSTISNRRHIYITEDNATMPYSVYIINRRTANGMSVRCIKN